MKKSINAIRLLLLFGLLIILISGCSGQSETPAVTTPSAVTNVIDELEEPATTTPYIVQMEVFPDQRLQVLKDVGGGNFIHRYGGADTPFEPVSKLNIKLLSPFMARVSIDLDIWEPENDNADPIAFETSGFKDEPGTSIRNTLEFMQSFQTEQTDDEETTDSVIIGSIWYVPDWMVENPADDRARKIPEEMIPEVVESIAAWLLHARDEYGVQVDYVSFNEANLGINVLLNGDEVAPLVIQAGDRFAELGLGTRWLLADASNIAETTTYARRIYTNADIHPYLGPLAFHSWDYTTSDQSLTNIAGFAEENNLEVWCTEGGWNPSLWQTPDKFSTFTNALNQAIIYTRVLKLTRATSLMYWEMMGSDYSMNDGTQPYPIFEFMEMLKKQFPPGATVLSTSKDPQSVKFVAAEVENQVVVLIINRNPIAEKAVLKGLPAGSYHLIRSDKTEMNQPITTYEIEKGSLEFEIAPSSINFITTQP